MDETTDRFVLKCCSTQIFKIGVFAKVSVYFFFRSQGEDDPELPVEGFSPVAGIFLRVRTQDINRMAVFMLFVLNLQEALLL